MQESTRKKSTADHCVDLLETLVIDVTQGYNVTPQNKVRRQLVEDAIIYIRRYRDEGERKVTPLR